jgi:uncharacterized protein YfaP (DUF2135 family)
VIRKVIDRIAWESRSNAYHHAQAQSIEAELRYDVLIVRDDGKEIDPKVLKNRGRAAHWACLVYVNGQKQLGHDWTSGAKRAPAQKFG